MTFEELKNKNTVAIFSHCDDEFLFGFPFIKNVKKMISCTDDLTHPTRQWCIRRKDAFKEIGDLLNIETKCLRYDSGFASRANKEIRRFVEDVRLSIKDAEVLITHNPWGEYGHLDHILLHQICLMENKPVYATDICFDGDWFIPKPHKQGEVVGHCQNSMLFHSKCMEIYRKFGAMGWTYPPILECNIIRVQ